MQLPPPFNTFRIEKHAGDYKDFGITDSSYPLKGVTYPVDYGDIEGYVAEDGANLDVFVGSGTLYGFITVSRPELPNGEHKFFINLSADEEDKVITVFTPVLLDHGRYNTIRELINAIDKFKQ